MEGVESVRKRKNGYIYNIYTYIYIERDLQDPASSITAMIEPLKELEPLSS